MKARRGEKTEERRQGRKECRERTEQGWAEAR